MFVQIIEGRAADTDGMKRLMQTWMDELRPGAAGFLGTTAGVTSDGRAIAVVRFESAAAASANSDRPEQGDWWAEMEACYDGDVSFAESEDVQEFLGGGSDDAGFVQVMKGHDIDRASLARLDRAFEEHAPTFRPDIIGGLRVWTEPDAGYDVTYFTSEAEARAGESKPLPPEFDEVAGDMERLMANTEFFDLGEPWLY
jgi:hypothetical protein